MSRVPSDERRDQLIDAAIRVAVRDGIAAVTTRTVAAEAGATPGIVHYVYHSMTDLLRDVITSIADEQVHAATSVQLEGGTVRDCLERAFEARWSALEAEPAMYQLTFEITQFVLRDDDLRELAAWQYDCYAAVSEETLRSIAKIARIEWVRPVESLARTVIAVNDGITLSWLVDRDTDRARALSSRTIDHLVSLARPVPG